MANMLLLVHQWEQDAGRLAMQFRTRHPCLAFWSVLVGMPVLLLAAVAASTTVVMLPVALALGWV